MFRNCPLFRICPLSHKPVRRGCRDLELAVEPEVTPAAGRTTPELPGLTVLGRLGDGAYAEVYRVRRGEGTYALKVLGARGSADPSQVVAFHREAALLARVSHPGLPRAHEAGTIGDRPYLLMDLVEGQRLTEALARGALPQHQVISLGIDLAGALGAAHAAGLVHRDVKPDNIVLSPDGPAHLVDFGLATQATDRTQTDVVAGTLAYCAPEQTGMLRRPVDGRADLYALGAVLFECATGAAPFSAPDVGELVRMHAVVPAPDPRQRRPDLAPSVAAIIGRLLAKDPDDRYQRACGLIADLRRAADQPDLPDCPAGAADAPLDEIWDRPLVGRQDELAALTTVWAAARAGRGAATLITGPAGSGKTRLARELVAVVSGEQRPVLTGHGVAGGALPLATLRTAVNGMFRSLRRMPMAQRQAVRQRLIDAATPVADLLAGLSPELAELLDPATDRGTHHYHDTRDARGTRGTHGTRSTHGAPAAGAGAGAGSHGVDDPGAADAAGALAQAQFTGAVAAFLTEFARLSGGAVLYLDDAQWLDDVTCSVLRQLPPLLPTAPLLVLATGRTADDDTADDDADGPGDPPAGTPPPTRAARGRRCRRSARRWATRSGSRWPSTASTATGSAATSRRSAAA
jgi:hypothetical protein